MGVQCGIVEWNARLVDLLGGCSGRSGMEVFGVVQFYAQGFLEGVMDGCVFIAQVSLINSVEGFTRVDGWRK